MSTEPLVVIPARLASSRLPGKPLKKIGNKTLIEHCVDSCRKSGVEPTVVSDNLDVLNSFLGCGYLTPRGLETGTDRVAWFVDDCMGWDDAPEWIINVQGDMPFGTAPFIRMLIDSTRLYYNEDVLTVACKVPFVNCMGDDFHRDTSLHHVGMYAFKKDALRKFYENRNNPEARKRELALSLEQCRCDSIGLDVVCVTDPKLLPPLEVNTQADLDRINEIVNACAGLGNPGFTADEAASLALAGGG